MDNNIAEVQKLIDLGQEERLSMLYTTFYPSSLHSHEIDKAHEGRKILNKLITPLKKKICSETMRSSISTCKKSSTIVQIRNLIKIIGVFYSGVTLIIIVAEILDDGVHKFCKAEWESQQK